jgi:hypothetical protein
MKKLLFLLPLLALSPLSARAQGWVLASNFTQDFQTEKFIYDNVSGLPLTSTYVAQLFAGIAGIVDETQLVAVDNPAAFFDQPAQSQGEFFGGEVQISGVTAGQTATLQIRIWPAVYATWAQAYNAAVSDSNIHVGKSVLFQQVTGTSGSMTEIANNAGFVVFTIGVVPEPSTVALGVLGCGLLLLRRRGR